MMQLVCCLLRFGVKIKTGFKRKKAVLRGCLFGWYHSTTILGKRLLKSLPLSAMLRAIWNAASV